MKLVDFSTFQNLMLLEAADAKAHVMLPIIAERAKICTTLASEYGQALYEKNSKTIIVKENPYRSDELCGFLHFINSQ